MQLLLTLYPLLLSSGHFLYNELLHYLAGPHFTALLDQQALWRYEHLFAPAERWLVAFVLRQPAVAQVVERQLIDCKFHYIREGDSRCRTIREEAEFYDGFRDRQKDGLLEEIEMWQGRMDELANHYDAALYHVDVVRAENRAILAQNADLARRLLYAEAKTIDDDEVRSVASSDSNTSVSAASIDSIFRRRKVPRRHTSSPPSSAAPSPARKIAEAWRVREAWQSGRPMPKRGLTM